MISKIVKSTFLTLGDPSANYFELFLIKVLDHFTKLIGTY